MIVNLIE